MEAVTLPAREATSIEQLRKKIITKERRLVSSIELKTDDFHMDTNAIRILNRPEQVDHWKDIKLRNEILALHGIPICPKNNVLREYILCVFQTKVIVMYRSSGTVAWTADRSLRRRNYQRVSVQEPGKEGRRVQMLAIRTIYALGLDYGTVICGITEGRKTGILRIITHPKLNDEMERAYLKAVYDYIQFLDKPRPKLEEVLIGADPEFIVQTKKGHLLNATKYFPRNGRVGYDAIWLGKNRNYKPVMEIRPAPTSDPKLLVIRIYQALLQASKVIGKQSVRWLAGALPHKKFPLGGHIHFSGVELNFKMLRAFDNYLALPFVIVEDPNGRMRRPKYGFLGDFRFQEHGGFEYRTLPSWLISPSLTKAVLSLAQLIAVHYRQLHFDPLCQIELQQAYYRGDKEEIRKWFDILWADIKRISDYQKYKSLLDEFYNWVVSGIVWNEKIDIRSKWRIPES